MKKKLYNKQLPKEVLYRQILWGAILLFIWRKITKNETI